MKIALKITLAVLLGLGLGLFYFAADQGLPTPSIVKQKEVSVYGIHAGMAKDDFTRALNDLHNTGKSPFVKWMASLNEEETKVVAIALIFPSEKFFDVAKELAKNGNLPCDKAQETICTLKGADGGEVTIVDKVYKTPDGKMFGVILLVDKDHLDPKHPTTPPENEHHQSKDLSDTSCPKPTRSLNGKCVSDL